MPTPLTNHLFSPQNHLFSFCFFFNLFLPTTFLFFSSTCHSTDEQGQALLTWKNGLNISTNALKSWSSADKSPCNWYGVYCNKNLQVIELNLKAIPLQGSLPSNFHQLKSLRILVLSSTNLTGTIPNEFGDYLDLVIIDISANSISSEIPVELCKLTKLEKLSLNSNFLKGNIPSNIGNLYNLKSLLLYDNQLEGEIPRSIGNLTKLEVFRAGGNQNLRGELPYEIGNCTNMATLGLAETGISGRLPSSIGTMKRLQTLAIYTAMLSGPIPDEISNCSALHHIYLYQNSLVGPIPARVGRLRRLESLLLWQNSIVGMIPDELGNCRELKVVDLSENLLTGGIPPSFGSLLELEALQLSVNQLSGGIPPEITKCTSLTHLEVDNNELSGEIPERIGQLKSLTLFFAWQNNLTGKIPESLSECKNLQALDLSYNKLSGPIPQQIFELKNLSKLLLISNEFSGFIPPNIGNCTNLYRLRLSKNNLEGTIPSEIGNLEYLNFFDLSNNRFIGDVPSFVYKNLEFLDMHSNVLTGRVPDSLTTSLRYIDFSDNQLTGPLGQGIGTLTELTKLNLGKNRIFGTIPAEILSCSRLQLLDLGDNEFSGSITKELGRLSSLEILLNLSRNQLTGEIPLEFSGLDKLGILDLSHNNLSGNLDILERLENLVTLNVSFNAFAGGLPNTPFFRKLPANDLAGNRGLILDVGVQTPANGVGPKEHAKYKMKLAMSVLVSISVLLVLLLVYIAIRAYLSNVGSLIQGDNWDMMFYQKIDKFRIDEVVQNLTTANAIGTGSSGVVYRVMVPSGETLAVKKLWSAEEEGAFRSEIMTLGSIRHKNIIRLLGWGSTKNMKLLFYDYLPNGSLSSLLHAPGGKGAVEWEIRYKVVLGVAHALAYLHHGCVPPIVHGDVKAMNVLLGAQLEAYLADFGLAWRVNNEVCGTDISKLNQRFHLAGSYGYMAPEQASMQCITEKSDVYSFGVVLLEVLTGRHPLDPTLPRGVNLVQWVRDLLHSKGDPIDVLDARLRGRTDPETYEMLQTLTVSFLCLSTPPDGRPIMKDVVAMLEEIRHAEAIRLDNDFLKGSLTTPRKSSPVKNVISQGSTSCSFAFSDDSIQLCNSVE